VLAVGLKKGQQSEMAKSFQKMDFVTIVVAKPTKSKKLKKLTALTLITQ
jgi:hypothetical protein